MEIKEKDKEYLLSLKPEDLSFTTLLSLFGDSESNGKVIKSRFNTTDTFTLYPKDYFVKEETKTTVGRFIYNKYIIERIGLQDILGYINYAITDSKNGGIEKILSKALLDDKMTVTQFHDYINYRDNLGMQLNVAVTTSFTQKTLITPPAVEKRKQELFKQYKKELDAGDIVVSERIEKELTAMAKEELKGDPGMDLYASEARGNFGNYKNMNLLRGAVYNQQKGRYDILQSSFMDGITKADVPAFGTAVVSGSYPKAVGTQESGYMSKQLLSSMQSEKLDEPGSDCGSKKTLEILLTDRNKKDFQYRYIVEKGKLIELTDDELNKRVGTKVHMRSPMYCTGDDICNICAGNMNYKLGTMYIGLGTSTISNTLLQMGMKKFHISTLSSKQINVDDMLI